VAGGVAEAVAAAGGGEQGVAAVVLDDLERGQGVEEGVAELAQGLVERGADLGEAAQDLVQHRGRHRSPYGQVRQLTDDVGGFVGQLHDRRGLLHDRSPSPRGVALRRLSVSNTAASPAVS